MADIDIEELEKTCMTYFTKVLDKEEREGVYSMDTQNSLKFHAAVDIGDLTIVKSLLEGHMSFLKDSSILCSLSLVNAVEKGHLDMVKYFGSPINSVVSKCY